VVPGWAWRCLHFGVALLATVSAVAGAALTARSSSPLYDEPEVAVELLGPAIAFGWAGAVLIGFPKARCVARILLAAAVAAGLCALALGIGSSQTGSPEHAMEVVASAGLSGALLLTLSLLPQAFPDGPLQLRRWPLVFRVTLWSIVALSLMFALGQDSAAGWFAFMLSLIGGTVLGTGSLLARWKAATARQRSQIALYFMLNVGLVFAVVLLPVVGPVSGVVLLLWPFIVVSVIGLSVLRFQLYDIRVVVKRVAIDATLAALVAVLFISVYFAALFLITERLDRNQYRWIALALAAFGVVLIEPLRRRVRYELERRLLGERRNPLAALDRLRESFSQSDEATLYAGVVETVAAAIRSPHVTLALQRDQGIDTVATIGNPVGEPLVLPLVYLGERLGELHVSPRTPGETFGHPDRQLLDQLAHQTAALVYAKRRDIELAGARRETVDAVVEERSRLGRDLHDGLAPLLAGAGLSAEALRRSLPPGSPDEEEAARLAALLRGTARDARRMAHDLQPPEPPADIKTALTDYLARLNGAQQPAFTVAIDVADLPSAVAQTAYLVLLEAINNVLRHANAATASLSASCDADRLHLEVLDDGIGLEQPYVSGVGITSMRRRVESLGGNFSIARRPDRGTRIAATIPLLLTASANATPGP
jgi:two-component system, NarL family, sensor kinase